MPLYQVNLEEVQYAITVLKRQRYILEEQVRPDLVQALGLDLVEGYPKVAQELQEAFDESSKFFQQIENLLKQLEDTLAGILNTYKS